MFYVVGLNNYVCLFSVGYGWNFLVLRGSDEINLYIERFINYNDLILPKLGKPTYSHANALRIFI